MNDMVRIIKPRGGGKTTSLLKLAKEHGYVVVEPTKECAVAVQKMADMRGLQGVCVISAYEFLKDSAWRRQKYLVDELDWFLKSIGVVGYSSTEGEE